MLVDTGVVVRLGLRRCFPGALINFVLALFLRLLLFPPGLTPGSAFVRAAGRVCTLAFGGLGNRDWEQNAGLGRVHDLVFRVSRRVEG